MNSALLRLAPLACALSLLLVACGESEEQPSGALSAATATETSAPTGIPTPQPTSTASAAPSGPFGSPPPEVASFREFARQIEDAVAAGDSAFFVDRAKYVHLTCEGEEQLGPCSDWPGGTVITGIPGSAWHSDASAIFSAEEYTAYFTRYWSAGRSDLSDEYGSGSLRLYALASRQAQDSRLFSAITTSIVDNYPTGYLIGRSEREAHVFNFELVESRWTFVSEIAATVSLAAGDWLSGNCSECYDYWERWEGAAH